MAAQTGARTSRSSKKSSSKEKSASKKAEPANGVKKGTVLIAAGMGPTGKEFKVTSAPKDGSVVLEAEDGTVVATTAEEIESSENWIEA